MLAGAGASITVGVGATVAGATLLGAGDIQDTAGAGVILVMVGAIQATAGVTQDMLEITTETTDIIPIIRLEEGVIEEITMQEQMLQDVVLTLETTSMRLIQPDAVQ